MAGIFPRQINRESINPDKLIRVEFSNVYSTIDSTGKRKKKPFSSLIKPIDALKKNAIAFYISHAVDCGIIMGPQIDDKTGREIPGTYFIYSDGIYAWTSKTVYQFEHYDMKLPDEFVEHILSQVN